MTSYNKSTDFAVKDTLLTGNPNKLVKGSEVDVEFTNIELADATNVKKTGNTGSAVIPTGTTAQRDAAPAVGYTRVNTSTGTLEWWNGTIWTSANGGDAYDIEVTTATGGQTVITTANNFIVGSNTLMVYLNGLLVNKTTDYTETTTTSFTFNAGLTAGDEVVAQIWRTNISTSGDAMLVSYTPAGTGAVATNVQAKLRESVSVKDFGAVGDGVADDTAAIQAALNSLPNPASGYYGGGRVYFPTGKYLISSAIYFPKNNIILYGDGSLSSMLVASPSFAGTEMVRIDPADHPSYVLYRNCSVRDIGFDHNNKAGIRSITANSLNDGCDFTGIRSINFDGNVLTVGKSAKVGGVLSQGLKVDSWFAITSTDLVDDVFVVNEANECLFTNSKAIGLSIGASNKVGFHIGKTALSQGIVLIGCSTAHLVNGVGIKYNVASQCRDFGCTLENVAAGVVFEASVFSSCVENTSTDARFYSTVALHARFGASLGCGIRTNENPSVTFDAASVNCWVEGSNNAALPAAVTNNSTTATVSTKYKGGIVTNAGSWTPVCTDGTNSATLSSVFGYYERIGNCVTVRCSFVVTSIGACAGAIQITGIPSAIQSSASRPFALGFAFADQTTLGANYTSPYVLMNGGSSTVLLRKTGTGIAAAALNFADIRVGGNNTNVIFTLVYNVN